MSEKERFDILDKEKINREVYFYLKNILSKLNIEITNECDGYIMDLMLKGKLEGWCWETTESVALFMPDDTLIYRGNLYFNDYKKYYHSFICFNFNNEKYVFDPCLRLINTYKLYFDTFKVDVKAVVSAKQIKDYFINYINDESNKKKESNSNYVSSRIKFMRKFFGDDYNEIDDSITIHDKDDVSSPMYRNSCDYKNINMEDNKVKSLTVHYYLKF